MHQFRIQEWDPGLKILVEQKNPLQLVVWKKNSLKLIYIPETWCLVDYFLFWVLGLFSGALTVSFRQGVDRSGCLRWHSRLFRENGTCNESIVVDNLLAK